MSAPETASRVDTNEDWVIDGIIAAMTFTRQSQTFAPPPNLPEFQGAQTITTKSTG
jgi:hypothetical protein